jgi:hypothetical protein
MKRENGTERKERNRWKNPDIFLSVLFFSVCSVFSLHSATGYQAESVDLTEHLRARQMELALSGGRLKDPVAGWFRHEAAQAQFVFIGEEHDVREIPVILGAMWHELAAEGYRHLAIEAGQWLGGRLDRFARFRDRKALEHFKAATHPRRPNISVPPSSDEDLALVELLGAVTKPRAPLIWGLDYEFKLTPPLRRLADLTADPYKRRQVKALLAGIEASERAGDYKMQAFKTEGERLIKTLHARPGTEARQILDSLAWRVSGDDTDAARDALMKRLFLRNYKAAQKAGEARPRVALRFGGYHGKRGLMFDFAGYDAIVLLKTSAPASFSR